MNMARLKFEEEYVAGTHTAGCSCHICHKYDEYQHYHDLFTSFFSNLETKNMTPKKIINLTQHDNPKYDSTKPNDHGVYIYVVESTTNTIEVHVGQYITMDKVNQLINSGTNVNITKPDKKINYVK